jgi:lipopolysaccharide/colanic/teichoic acid biosynthesis glycosyltransferase
MSSFVLINNRTPIRAPKLIFDYAIAILMLIVLAVPMVCIALVIRLTSSGPVLFRQPRVGLNNKIFVIYKFRTMFDHRDQGSIDGSHQVGLLDVRFTWLGKWLRKFSIDELPQLFNVMRGNMSLVGPRPHPLRMNVGGQSLQDIVANYSDRHRVLPGITGWAQVNGWRGATIFIEQVEQRVAHDLFYINNWSLLFDIRILFLTLRREILSSRAF